MLRGRTIIKIALAVWLVAIVASLTATALYYGIDHAVGHSHNGTFTVTTSP